MDIEYTKTPDAIDIGNVLERRKELEQLVTSFDPAYTGMLTAIEIVRQFIIDKELILYGGTSIDMALRLKGDKIYPDDLLPDWDFYSPLNVEHSYQLADLLYAKGFADARSINALHMETMKVDIGDNHFIADITYRPQAIFDKLPVLMYNGMRLIHPDFQRIDMHSSLAFPYDNVPREVIFDRWSKDIIRFNKLVEHYPIGPSIRTDIKGEATKSPDPLPLREVSVRGIGKYVLTGFAAYAAIYSDYAAMIKALGGTIPATVEPAKFTISRNDSSNDSNDSNGNNDTIITFDTLNQAVEIVHFDPENAIKALAPASVKHYEPYLNLIPERYECNKCNKCNKNNDSADALSEEITIIYSTHNRLVCSNSVDIGAHLRVTGVQYLLKHFLSMYFMYNAEPRTAATYLRIYTSLLAMIESIEIALLAAGEAHRAAQSPLFLTVYTYGNDNINLAREIALNRLYNELDGTPRYKIPMNYYPARSKNGCHPAFNPAEILFFQEEGREIKIE